MAPTAAGQKRSLKESSYSVRVFIPSLCQMKARGAPTCLAVHIKLEKQVCGGVTRGVAKTTRYVLLRTVYREHFFKLLQLSTS